MSCDESVRALRARFVDRPNRFLVIAELSDGTHVEAYLPNTGRLTHLLRPGRPLILRSDAAEHRKTALTAIRAWDGCWVALEAALAPALVADWLAAGRRLGRFGVAVDVRREVPAGRHRFDLVVGTATGPVWVEVKSAGRAAGEEALLSGTPSTRGVAHLAALGRMVEGGERAAAAFVIPRPDVSRLRVGGDADPTWVAAVVAAREAGVEILAFSCDVDETTVRIVRELPVVYGDR